jgi:Na+/melibiose symporter-like transporter
MNSEIYLLLAVIAGASWGTSLGYLLNAPRTKTSEWRQWLSLATSGVIVICCAVVMKYAGELGQLSFAWKVSAGVGFAIALVFAFKRCQVKL